MHFVICVGLLFNKIYDGFTLFMLLNMHFPRKHLKSYRSCSIFIYGFDIHEQFGPSKPPYCMDFYPVRLKIIYPFVIIKTKLFAYEHKTEGILT